MVKMELMLRAARSADRREEGQRGGALQREMRVLKYIPFGLIHEN